MNNKNNFYNIRSSKECFKWLIVSLITAVCCMPSGFLLLKDEPFAWANLVLFVVGVVALFLFFTSSLVMMGFLASHAERGGFEDVEKTDEEPLQPDQSVVRDFVMKGADDIPTSLVTTDLIRQTMEQMQPGEHFMLTSMIPLKSAWGESYDLSCHRIDGERPFVIVAYFAGKDNESIVYTLRFISTTKAYAILSNYFEKREVPDVSDWENQTHRLNQHTPLEDYVLYVDGHKYDHITYEDVMVSWEELNEGKCKSILLRTPSWQNGYMGVVGSKDKYTVEVAGFDSNHEICGFRTQTKYGGHVTYWLSDYFHEYKYPEIRADWEDISEEVRAYNKN